MGSLHIRQPNGNWAVWETEADEFSAIDCTILELEQLFMDRAMKRAEVEFRNSLKSNNWKTWDDCKNRHREQNPETYKELFEDEL